jgi:hypothetical protein
MISTRGAGLLDFVLRPTISMTKLRSASVVKSMYDTHITLSHGAELPRYSQAEEQATANEQASRFTVPISLVGYGPS